MKTRLVLLAASMVALVACDNRPAQYQALPQNQPQIIQAAQAPVVVQQDSGMGVGTAVAAGALGYMLGSAGSRNGSNYAAPVAAGNTTIINKTTIVNPPVPTPTPSGPPSARPSFVTPNPTLASPVQAAAAKPAPSFAPKTSYAQAAPKVTYSAPSRPSPRK
jgi:hypothetical protein